MQATISVIVSEVPQDCDLNVLSLQQDKSQSLTNEVSLKVGDSKVSIPLPSFTIESESLDQTETDLNEVCGPL